MLGSHSPSRRARRGSRQRCEFDRARLPAEPSRSRPLLPPHAVPLRAQWDALDDERKRHFEEVARDERKRAMKEEEELDELHAQEQERRRHEKSALPSERSQRKVRAFVGAQRPRRG